MRKTNYILNETAATTTLKIIKQVSGKFKAGPMTVLDNVLIKDGNLLFTDLETTITVYDFLKNKKINCLVNRSDFFKIIEAIGNEPFSFEQTIKLTYSDYDSKEENFLYIKTDTDTFTLDASLNVDEFPELPNRSFYYKAVIGEKDFNNIYRALPFTSNEEMRPAMCGVYFNHDIVATNGHQLFRIKSKANINDVIIFPKNMLNQIKPFKPAKAVLYEAVEDNGKYYKFRFNNIGIEFRSIKAKYPDYESVWPITEEKGIVKFNKKDVQKSIKKVSIVASGTDMKKIKFTPDYNNWNLTAKDKDTNTEALSKFAINAKGQFEPFGVNGSYFEQILNHIPNEKIKLNFFSANKAIILNDNFLLMPVKI